MVDIEKAKEHALLTKSVPETNSLWHQRYGHLNLHYLSHLDKERLVDGILDIQQKQQGICGYC